jgi:hypothetical protein
MEGLVKSMLEKQSSLNNDNTAAPAQPEPTQATPEPTPQPAATAEPTPEPKVEPTAEPTPTPQAQAPTTPVAEPLPNRAPETPTVEEKPQPKTWSEAMEILNDNLYEQYGYTYEDIEAIHSIDLDEMEDSDVIVNSMLLNDPDMTEREIEVQMKKFDVLYMDEAKLNELIEEGKITQDEVDARSAEFDRMLRNARRAIEEVQGELPKPEQIEFGMAPNKSGDATQEGLKQLVEFVNGITSEYQSEKFDIKDKDGNVIGTVSYGVDDTAKAQIKDTIANPNGIWSRWVDTIDGKAQVNHSRMLRDMTVLTQFENIARSIYNEAFAKGSKAELEKIDNVTFDRNGQTRTAQKTDDATEAMKQALRTSF